MTTRRVLKLLRDYESRNVTYMEADGSWPIVWERARGVHVWNAEGKRFVDLTAAFGVAAAGHANPRVVRAGTRQMNRLLHAMGDVHPHARKAELARELSRLTFERWSRRPTSRAAKRSGAARWAGKSIFCNSGFEAVEAALKTALLASGKPGVIAFRGAYHGLGYGALNVTQRGHFRTPFLAQIGGFSHFLPFPAQADEVGGVEASIRRLIQRENVGAILVEPIQVRGGINLPPLEFLPRLRRVCDETGVVLILDEIYTGFGRTGRWFACEHSGVAPDLICLGKALTGGFPLSVCVGRADLMDRAWPASNGEAIHTSTFLGHPVGCAMALAQIAELKARQLPREAARIGARALVALGKLAAPAACSLAVRGVGLFLGVELRLLDGAAATEIALAVIKGMLRRGYVLLPEGEHSNVVSLTPPLTITPAQLDAAVAALAAELAAVDARPERQGVKR